MKNKVLPVYIDIFFSEDVFLLPKKRISVKPILAAWKTAVIQETL